MSERIRPESSPRTPGSDAGDGLDADVVVIGAGLAGLTAAAYAARGGARVVVLERAAGVGGRAITRERSGYLFNVGPHALYDGGSAARAFAELGVAYSGRRPPASGGLAYHRGGLHALPGGFVSLLTTDLLGLSGKLELGRVLGSLAGVDASLLRGRTLRQWLDATFRDVVVRGLVEALMRLTAYANNPETSCAAASVAQLQHGLAKGVLYLDGGWATLVDGLRRAAEEAGAAVRTGMRVRRVAHVDGRFEVQVGASVPTSTDAEEDPTEVLGIQRDSIRESSRDDATLRARVVIVAVPPAAAAGLVDGEAGAALRQWAADAQPVKAACLDLGLRRLPDPRRLFVVGIDKPFYFSVHSASARLAPDGGAVVHVAKYLGPEPEDAKAVERELEAFCDVVQPKWRDEVVERRYLPSMLVTGALVAASGPRAPMDAAATPGLLLAGDWVGDESMIADAAVASGRRAGLEAVALAVSSRRAGSSPAAGRGAGLAA